jgi:predicted RNA binding protein YcfA (HicA-like mRNA interferase family)
MGKREKLLGKLKNSPNNVTFDQVEKVLLNEGFALERISSSHHVFKKGEVTFVIPVHRNKVKAVYVKRVVEIIEDLNDENS